MIVEMRTYIFRPGMLPAFLALCERIRDRNSEADPPNMLGYFTSETGRLNQVVHRGVDGMDERMERRAKLATDVEWQRF